MNVNADTRELAKAGGRCGVDVVFFFNPSSSPSSVRPSTCVVASSPVRLGPPYFVWRGLAGVLAPVRCARAPFTWQALVRVGCDQDVP